MLKIKSSPNHQFDIFVELASNIDPEWLLGRFDKNGNLIEKEIECELDEKQAIIKLYDYFKKPFLLLPILNFVIRLGYGFDGKTCQQILKSKYGNKINNNTEIAIIQYELIEFI